MKLNEKGQCPVCLIKPLTYKRDGKYFCHRCGRDFDIKTEQWKPNNLWVSENEKSRLSKMAELAMKTGIARPCNFHDDGLHSFHLMKNCECGEANQLQIKTISEEK